MKDIVYLLWMCFVVFVSSITVVRVSCFPQSLWQEDETRTDVAFNGGVLFSAQIESKMHCAQLCAMNEVKCNAFSYTYTTEECRGYRGDLIGQVIRPSTSLWERVCKRAGYTYDPDFDTCVRLYTVSKTWTEAADTCNKDGAYLLITDTRDKLTATKYGLHGATFQTKDRWWVGGYDYDDSLTDDYRWITGLSINISLWHPSEPNSAAERCVNMYAFQQSLNDLSCSNEEYFACQEDIEDF